MWSRDSFHFLSFEICFQFRNLNFSNFRLHRVFVFFNDLKLDKCNLIIFVRRLKNPSSERRTKKYDLLKPYKIKVYLDNIYNHILHYKAKGAHLT